MNTNLVRTMMAAAALLVAGSASAQSYRAEVPMAFRVGNKTMAAGSYELRLNKSTAGNMLFLYGRNDKSSGVLVGTAGDAPKAWRDSGEAKIAFECTDDTCSLRKVWDGSAAVAYVFPAQKGAATVTAHRTEFVTLSMIKAH